MLRQLGFFSIRFSLPISRVIYRLIFGFLYVAVMIVKSWNCTGLAGKLNTVKFCSWPNDAEVVGLQETFLDTKALQVSGFSSFIKPARPAPPGKKHRATGGLVTLVSSQLASAYRPSVLDGIDFVDFENLCVHFERLSDVRTDLPPSFTVVNCYVVAHPASFDFSGLFFALEAYLLALEGPVIILGDFNAHWRQSDAARLPSVRDRDFREFVLRMEDVGFSWCPSSAKDLRGPTFISTQGSTMIDYFFVRGAPISGYGRESLTTFGHRGLRLSVDWPAASTEVLRDRTSHRKRFRVPPPATFFEKISAAQALHSVHDFLSVGVSRVFAFFILCLGELFQVSRGTGGVEASEPWHRYLSDFELLSLRRAEKAVFDLLSGALVGEVPLGLRERETELRDLRRSLHRMATRRLFEEVRGSYDDPTRLWAFIFSGIQPALRPSAYGVLRGGFRDQ